MQEGPAGFSFSGSLQSRRPLLHRDKRDGATKSRTP
jgi:hypothetical protein